MSVSPFISAAGTDTYVPSVTPQNQNLAVNQFSQVPTITSSTAGASQVTSTGTGIPVVANTGPPTPALKSIATTSPITSSDSGTTITIGFDTASLNAVTEITAGAGIGVTGGTTSNPTISNAGVIDLTAADGSIIIDATDPQHPTIQAVVSGGSGGTVTNVSSANSSISVASPTTTPVLTFNGVSRLIQGANISMTSTKGSGPNDLRGDVTINATGGGGGGGGGTVTNVSSTSSDITVANPTTIPSLTFNGVSRLIQGTGITLTPTKGSSPSDARGNVTIAGNFSSLATAAALADSFPRCTRFSNNIVQQSPTPIVNYGFTSTAWHAIQWTNSAPNIAPYPNWIVDKNLPFDVKIAAAAPGNNQFTLFSGNGGLTIPYLSVQRSGMYLISYDIVFRNNNTSLVADYCLFGTFNNGTNWLEVSGTSGQSQNTDSEEFTVSRTTISGLSTSGVYALCAAVSNYDSGNIKLGSVTLPKPSPTGNAVTPCRAQISFTWLAAY